MVRKQLEFVEGQITLLDQQIEAYMAKLDSPVTTIPGVGPVYGAVILSELGDIHRFPSAKQIVSYAGIDAQVHESGEFKGDQTHMSKQGITLSAPGHLGRRLCCVLGGSTTQDLLPESSGTG